MYLYICAFYDLTQFCWLEENLYMYSIDLRVWQETKIGQLLTQSLLHNSEICAVFGQIELAQIFLKISNDLQFFKKGGILEY